MYHGEFNRLTILGSLSEAANHGYSLHDKIDKEGFTGITSGGMYRVLRTLADEGLIESSWDMPEKGPARRIYSITQAGRDHMMSERKALHDHVLQAKQLLAQIPRS